MVTEEQAVVPVSHRCKLTPAHILHRVAGRMRLRIPWIKNRPQLAQALAGTLSGIHDCRANAECASITISYDPHRWTSNRLFGTAQYAQLTGYPTAGCNERHQRSGQRNTNLRMV